MSYLARSSLVLLSVVLLASTHGYAQEPTSKPGEKSKPSRKASDEEVDAKYQALFDKMTPEQQAWERVLQANLGNFYLPAHKRDKIEGKSNAWDFVQDDPSLPRVLLIGDSISRGYTLACRDALKGKANVHRAPANCGPTSYGLQKLDVWLGDGKWDLIYFNFGLHDHNAASPVDAYAKRLEQIVERLEKTGAKLVWASSTPDPDDVSGKSKGEPVGKFNAAAAEVMKKRNVPVDDLYTVITPHLADMQQPDGHFFKNGYDFLGQHAAEFIEKTLH